MSSSSGTRPIQASGAISSEGNAADRQRPLSTASGTGKRPRGVSATATAAAPAPFAPSIARSPIVRRLRPLSVAEAPGELALPALHAPRLGGRALVVVAQGRQH